MKTIFTLLVLFTAFSLSAQQLKEAQVPAAVKQKFTSLYPNAKDVKWEKEDYAFEAEFLENTVETSMLFNVQGDYIQKEVEIPVTSLPAAVGDYITKNVGKPIAEAAKITHAKGVTTYEAEAGGTDYLFDSNGNFLRKGSDSNHTEDAK